MSEVSSNNAALNEALNSRFAGWLERDGNAAAVNALEPRQVEALGNLLSAELSEKATFSLRSQRYDDLRQFDFSLNRLTGTLLDELDRTRAPGENGGIGALHGSLFEGKVSAADVEKVTAVLNDEGYCLSPVSLDRAQLDAVFSVLRGHTFATKGIPSKSMQGGDLIDAAQKGGPGLDSGDTFWLTDQDRLARDPLLFRLAFDPFIIAVAKAYFGCAPVHAQTNSWFSFPSAQYKSNLSANAQMYHQDKEFVKFLKVFVYLTDVTDDSGPHRYVAGSHHDELHRKGEDISERVSDADIGKFYDPSRIRTVTGPAGLIMFGDTSCVHKGSPVIKGYRAMLQLEYTTSLYISPVKPFNSVDSDALGTFGYGASAERRLLANYDSTDRAEFAAHELASAAPAPRSNPLLNFARVVKRRVRTALGR